MRRGSAVALLGLLGLLGCGSDGSVTGDQPELVETPATVVGVLDVSVEEGDVGPDEISDVNFGSVQLDDGYVLVEIPGDVLRASDVERDMIAAAARFEVSLAGPSELVFDESTPYYVVDAITPLD